MKVRLLKDLPTCQAGTIGVKEGSQIVFDKNTRSPYFFELGEIEHKTEWFEILPDEPVWARERWILSTKTKSVVTSGNSMVCCNTSKQGNKGLTEWHERKNLIAKAPEMWRLLEKIRTAPIHEMHDLKCEIDELLKSIES